MAFNDDARAFIRQLTPEFEARLASYVPRAVVREGVTQEQLPWLRWLAEKTPAEESDLVQDIDLPRLKRVLLIGNAGSGKSQVLMRGFLTQCQCFLANSTEPFPLFLDLGTQLPTNLDLDIALTHWSNGLFQRAIAEHPAGVVLFLDALDEALLRSGGAAYYNDLRIFLQNYRNSLTVMIACRRPAWNPLWFQGVEPAFVTFNCDYLESSTYNHLIPEDSQRARFFGQVQELGISNLLDSPFIGFALARSFLTGAPLPPSRHDWFEQQITRFLNWTESNLTHSQPPLARLRFLSEQLACIDSFSGLNSWSVQEATNLLAESAIQPPQPSVQSSEFESLFQSPIFRRTGGRFSFVHQLFREYLTATAISPLPLRKQRQLLEASQAGPQHRLRIPARGIAINLAEISPRFQSFLIENDPLVAFLSEMPGLPAEVDEQLTKLVIDQAVSQHRAPWWEIPPRGERPVDWLSKHCPRNVGEFVRPYLQQPNEIARLWGTAALSAWGGSRELNPLLVDLAHDDSQNVEIRKDAIEAVLATGEVPDIYKLYDLLDSRDDQIRGQVLDAYRVTDHPTPQEFIAHLRGGAHDDRLRCLLQVEPLLYAQTLNARQLEEALRLAEQQYEDIGSLRDDLLQGLLRRANELNFLDIPASLILKIWGGGTHYDIFIEKELTPLLQNNPVLFAKIWSLLLQRVTNLQNPLEVLYAGRHLAVFCTDQIFDLIPAETTLNDEQKRFVGDTVASYFYTAPTLERLQLFQKRAGSFAAHLRVPQPTERGRPRDRLAEPAQIGEILNRQNWDTHRKVFALVRLILELAPQTDSSHQTADRVRAFVQELPAEWQTRVLAMFRECVTGTTYQRSREGSTGQTTFTHPVLLTPFWVLFDLGETFSPQKIAEVILCYGFLWGDHRAPTLLDQLWRLDADLWQQCLLSLADSEVISTHEFFDYLISRQIDLYLARCRERLLTCDFGIVSFNALLDYWAALQPADYEGVLKENYIRLKGLLAASAHNAGKEETRSSTRSRLRDFSRWSEFSPLLLLLREDDDWAWQELHNRIRAEDVPLDDHQFYVPRYRQLQFPLNSEHLATLADWYAYIKRQAGPDHLTTLDQILLNAIVQIGGDPAIAQLQRLIKEQAYPGVEWLSYSILHIEEARLQTGYQPLPPRDLLAFINRETFGIVQSNRDLYEWVRQAVEEIKEGIELRAEQVQGYWNVTGNKWQPKDEVACQNVLWPMLRTRMEHLNIVGVEEKRIAADSADFWVEKPLEQWRARVIIELKTARQNYGEAELIAPLGEQLWRRYLHPSGVGYGLYIVIWFKDTERYPFPTRWQSNEEFLAELEAARDQLIAEYNISLACYLIDATTMPRLH